MTDLAVSHLAGVFATAIRSAHRAQEDLSPAACAERFADLMAGRAHGVRLQAVPVASRRQCVLPFVEDHTISVDCFRPVRTGGLGGPEVDLLWQVWMDTEEQKTAFGVPLLFRPCPPDGRLPARDWADLTETCGMLRSFTPSAVVIFLSVTGAFDRGLYPGAIGQVEAFGAMATTIAGSLTQVNPTMGRPLDDLSVDLTSGWIGDPALSGRGSPDLQDQFLTMFATRNVLRFRVERTSVAENPLSILGSRFAAPGA